MATPVAGTNSQILAGGTAIQAAPAGINGGFIVNPYLAADQGIGSAEVLYVSPVVNNPGSAPGAANGTTFAIQPGQTWNLIAGQATPTFVNAATTGHKFSVVVW